MINFNEFLDMYPELQELSFDEQQFFYDSYVEDYRYSTNILREESGEYGSDTYWLHREWLRPLLLFTAIPTFFII